MNKKRDKKTAESELNKEISQATLNIPPHIFRDRSLSVLEAITEYMKEKLNMTYHEIAVALNRDDRTIWTCYSRAKNKRKGKEAIPRPTEEGDVPIPFDVFKDRKLSVLEVMTEYLKERLNMTYHTIASLLNRDDRTIWTVYYRVKQKRGIKV